MKQTSLRIDEQTDRNLTILKERLYSPKAWIVRKLVAEKLKQVLEQDLIAK
jgi:predicted DNA-binding protein